MLVLTRNPQEKIMVEFPHGGPTIIIQVVAIVGGKVRLGIEAPRDVEILRGELTETAEDGRTLEHLVAKRVAWPADY